jgi:hypothetical protein
LNAARIERRSEAKGLAGAAIVSSCHVERSLERWANCVVDAGEIEPVEKIEAFGRQLEDPRLAA